MCMPTVLLPSSVVLWLLLLLQSFTRSASKEEVWLNCKLVRGNSNDANFTNRLKCWKHFGLKRTEFAVNRSRTLSNFVSFFSVPVVNFPKKSCGTCWNVSPTKKSMERKVVLVCTQMVFLDKRLKGKFSPRASFSFTAPLQRHSLWDTFVTCESPRFTYFVPLEGSVILFLWCSHCTMRQFKKKWVIRDTTETCPSL